MSPRLPRLPGRRGAEPQPPVPPPTGEQPIAGPGGLDGIRAWLSELERKMRIRSWIAIGLALVGIGLGVAGLLIAQNTRDDAATEEDLNEVRTKITTVEQSAQQAASEDIAAFSRRLDALEQKVAAQGEQIDRNRSEIRVNDDDIEDLRGDLADLADRVSGLESEADTGAAGASDGN